MKRIGVTQRLDPIPGRSEWRDALDYRWAPLLWDLGLLAVPLASGMKDHNTYLRELSLDGFLLTGGNDIGSVPQRDSLEKAVLDDAGTKGLPVLGICRGLQFINHYQGGRLVSVEGHVAVRHELRMVASDPFRLPIEVNSYHNLAVPVNGLGTDLEVLAEAPDGTVEALRHVLLPWLGIMWHPERDGPIRVADRELIDRHFRRVRI